MIRSSRCSILTPSSQLCVCLILMMMMMMPQAEMMLVWGEGVLFGWSTREGNHKKITLSTSELLSTPSLLFSDPSISCMLHDWREAKRILLLTLVSISSFHFKRFLFSGTLRFYANQLLHANDWIFFSPSSLKWKGMKWEGNMKWCEGGGSEGYKYILYIYQIW